MFNLFKCFVFCNKVFLVEFCYSVFMFQGVLFNVPLSFYTVLSFIAKLPDDQFVVFQSLRHVQLFVTPVDCRHQTSLSFTISCTLLKLMSIELVMPFPFSSCPQSFPPSGSFPMSSPMWQKKKKIKNVCRENACGKDV